MANTILTPTAVTREILRILHQKANFIGTVNRQYDEQFAKTGGKIGSTLKIRKPNQYTVRTGRAINVQDTTEDSVTLTVASQAGVDMYFTSEELTMSLDDFSKRIIEPAVNVLVSKIESDFISDVYKDIYQAVDNSGSAMTYAKLLAGKKKMTQALVPESDRVANVHPQVAADLISAFSTLYNQQAEIGKQFKQGRIGVVAGFDFYENSHWPVHTTGTETNTMDINGANQTGASITVTNGSSKTLAAGDVITLAGCNRVHPESKADTGELMQFVVTSAVTSGGTSISISPSIVTTGATQNVSASPTDAGAVTCLGGNSAAYDVSLLYHPDAFTFATADLQMPKGVDWAAREVLDGVSIRLVRDYDISDDSFPCRLDILYGWQTVRPELAVRLTNN